MTRVSAPCAARAKPHAWRSIWGCVAPGSPARTPQRHRRSHTVFRLNARRRSLTKTASVFGCIAVRSRSHAWMAWSSSARSGCVVARPCWSRLTWSARWGLARRLSHKECHGQGPPLRRRVGRTRLRRAGRADDQTPPTSRTWGHPASCRCHGAALPCSRSSRQQGRGPGAYADAPRRPASLLAPGQSRGPPALPDGDAQPNECRALQCDREEEEG